MPTLNDYPEQSLTIPQRDELLAGLHRDGYVVMPDRLPDWMIEHTNKAIDRLLEGPLQYGRTTHEFMRYNVVELDPMFRRLMMYKPALQLCHDVFGPSFILSQDQFRVFRHDPNNNEVGAIEWHSDGPATFPLVDGRCPMHTVRFGYFLTDATRQDCGSLDVVRGSHKQPVVHARPTLHWAPRPTPSELQQSRGAEIEKMEKDLVEIRAPIGSVVAFHNGIWHRAKTNRTSTPRRIAYFQYTPTWMRPHHRSYPTDYDVQAYSNEERWLLGEPRPAVQWMVPSPESLKRLERFGREAK